MVENRPKQLKADTRQWPGGRVKFTVIGWKDKPEKNYIIFEKNFSGKTKNKDQRFNLLFRDWQNLKKLIDEELSNTTGWTRKIRVADIKSLNKLIGENPEFFEKILENPNILNLSDASLEYLDRIATKIYEVKAEKIDLIFKKISETSAEDLNRFSALLDDLRLNQISMMTALVYQKLKIIDLLEKITINPRNKESQVHRIFENHTWLLGRSFEIVSSDRALSEFLKINVKNTSEIKKRPDLIAKTIPYSRDVILIELKAPGIRLKAKHVGQVLEYKSLIQKHKPNIQNIYCFIYGYEKGSTFTLSKDVVIKTFSELIAELRDEYKEYQKVLDIGSEVHIGSSHNF